MANGFLFSSIKILYIELLYYNIQEKLTHNSDHYPSESFNKVVYVMTRLGGEASKHTTLKRRQKALSSNELLDMLSDLYRLHCQSSTRRIAMLIIT